MVAMSLSGSYVCGCPDATYHPRCSKGRVGGVAILGFSGYRSIISCWGVLMTTWTKIKIALYAVVGIFVAAIVFRNTEPVTVNLIFYEGEQPLILLLLGMLLAGTLFGFISAAFLIKRKPKDESEEAPPDEAPPKPSPKDSPEQEETPEPEESPIRDADEDGGDDEAVVDGGNDVEDESQSGDDESKTEA